MILVTGATGHLGTATIDQLLKTTSPDKIVALARDEAKAQPLKAKGVAVRIGNFDDIPSLEAAMQGIEKVLLISTIDHHRYQQHQNVVDAATKAGVQHIAYTSVTMKDVTTSTVKMLMDSHFETEYYIKASGLHYTFLRNTLYADMIPAYVGEGVFERGIYFPAGDGKVAFALRREMGEAAANVLLQAGHENKTYQVTGGELHSFQDVADELSALSGKKVSYTDADAATFPEKLKGFGVPEASINIVADFAADIKNHQYEIVSSDMETLLGRKPASLRVSLKEIYGL